MRVDLRRCLFVLCCCVLAPAVCAVPANPVPACSAAMQSLAGAAGVLRDGSGHLTADAVMHLPASRFHAVPVGQRLGYGPAVWWLRVELRNARASACQRWLRVGPAGMRDVRVYVQHDGDWHVMRSGSHYPFDQWALPRRKPVFPLTLAPHATTHVLMRVQARGEGVAVTPQLWDPVDFRIMSTHYELGNGLLFGSMLLLVFLGMLLSRLYRRPALFYVALCVGCYTAYLVARSNYLLVNLWPEWPSLNTWARYFFISLTFAGANWYVCDVVKVRRLGTWWAWPFVAAQTGFVLIALVGGLVDAPTLVTRVMLGMDMACQVLWGLALVVGWRRGTLRGWYAPFLVGLIWSQTILVNVKIFGDSAFVSTGEQAFAVAIIGNGAVLLGTLVSQVRKGRQHERHARAELDRRHATEHERLQHAVTTRTADLGRALQARQQLLARISHDLRSPLAGMLDSARQWHRGDTRRDHPHWIERHARQQMQMIDELLAFSRTELADLEMRPVAGDLHAFVAEVAEEAERIAERHGNRLQHVFSERLPAEVRVDFGKLRPVLINLLGNAAKFTDHGRVRFAVEPGAPAPRHHVRLHFVVDDEGPGMARAEREQLMRAFVRGEQGAHRDGYGLGLSIVGRLLGRMDSRLVIDDAPGGGSRFHFELVVPVEPLVHEAGVERERAAGKTLQVGRLSSP